MWREVEEGAICCHMVGFPSAHCRSTRVVLMCAMNVCKPNPWYNSTWREGGLFGVVELLEVTGSAYPPGGFAKAKIF